MRTGSIAIVLLIFFTLLPLAAESQPAYGSISIGLDAELLSYDGIPAFMGEGVAIFRGGYEFTENWGLYGLGGAGVVVNIMTMHDFLEFPAIPKFMLGLGFHWRQDRFTLGLEADVLLSQTAGSMMLGGHVRLLPKYAFLVLQDKPIGYAISFPITAEISVDGWSVSAGIAFSMEVGKHLDGRSPYEKTRMGGFY